MRHLSCLASLVTVQVLRGSMALAQMGVVQCPTHDCPASVGEIAIEQDDHSKDVCGATLISPDTVLTAHHCLPPSLREVGASCTGRISLHLPATKGADFEFAECGSVVGFTPYPPEGDQNDHPDWALIRLTRRLNRPPARVRQRPLGPEEAVHGFAVSPTIFGADDLVPLKGQGVNVGYLFPLTFSAEAPLFFAGSTNHEIAHGHSGTALFDANEELVAVLSASYDSSRFKQAAEPNQAFLATKVACIPGLSSARSTACDLKAEDESTQVLAGAVAAMASLPPAAALAPKTVDPINGRLLDRVHDFYPNFDWRSIEPLLEKDTRAQESFTNAFSLRFPAMAQCWPMTNRVPYTVIAFGDSHRAPLPDGNFPLALGRDMSLRPLVRSFDLEFDVDDQPDNNGNFAGHLRVPPEELAFGPGDEQELSKCDDSESSVCQGLREKALWRRNLPYQEIRLPRCTVKRGEN